MSPPGAYWDKPLGAKFLDGLPDPQPVPWLTAEDIAFYGREFSASGFRGPLNRYRNHERDYAWLQGWRASASSSPACSSAATAIRRPRCSARSPIRSR